MAFQRFHNSKFSQRACPDTPSVLRAFIPRFVPPPQFSNADSDCTTTYPCGWLRADGGVTDFPGTCHYLDSGQKAML